MSPPVPGGHFTVGEGCRIVAVDDMRTGVGYAIELRFGFEDWQRHSAPRAEFSEVMAEAQQLLRRERGERSEDGGPSEFDFQNDSRSWLRGDQLSRSNYNGVLSMPSLAQRIRKARRMRGLAK